MPVMSANVEQRIKESSTKGEDPESRIVTDEDFEQYLRSNSTQNHLQGTINTVTTSNTENYLPTTFYTTSNVNNVIPSLPFPYLNTGMGDTWSTTTGSLFPNTNGTFSALPEQILTAQGHTSAQFMNGIDQVTSTALPNNIAYLNQQALFFPGNTTDLSWGGQAQTTSASILGDFYQQSNQVHENPTIPAASATATAVATTVDETEGVEHSFSGLSISPEEVKVNGDVHHNGSSSPGLGNPGGAPKPKSWAAIASQPAKPKPPPPKVKAQNTNSGNRTDSTTWNGSNTSVKNTSTKQGNSRNNQQRSRSGGNAGSTNSSAQPMVPILERLRSIHEYNPKEFGLKLKDVRFFIIKSYSEDDIHRSIKYNVWTSTEHGNRRLNDAFKEQQRNGKGPMYLLFSVNGSGHFCGVAEMKSEVEYDIETGIWSQEKWKGKFAVKWHYVKDVPNNALRHIRLENNDNKPVTNSRDTQEVPVDKGIQVVRIIHSFKNQTSIFDDFGHYEKRQEEEIKSKGKKLVGVEAP